jgi:hypothetical protein
VRPDSGGVRDRNAAEADKGILLVGRGREGKFEAGSSCGIKNNKFFPAIGFGSRWPHRPVVLTRWRSEANAKEAARRVAGPIAGGGLAAAIAHVAASQR